MDDLKCQPCRKGDEPATEDYIRQRMTGLPQWQRIEEEGIERLRRSFRFSNFAKALAFTNAVAALAEEQHHHPAILTEWGRVTVTWWTHAIGGLHRNDLIMAALTDRLDPAGS